MESSLNKTRPYICQSCASAHWKEHIFLIKKCGRILSSTYRQIVRFACCSDNLTEWTSSKDFSYVIISKLSCKSKPKTNPCSFKQALNQITAINVVLKSGLVSEAMDELLIKSNLTYLEKLVSWYILALQIVSLDRLHKWRNPKMARCRLTVWISSRHLPSRVSGERRNAQNTGISTAKI